ncbi:beta-ketoacyl synthase N-terminal-like domain-containing protein [Bradyrhizobium paxllaeri]
MNRRVVITGMRGLCGLGTCAAASWKEMRESRSAIGQIVNSELYELKVRIAADFKARSEQDIDRKQLVDLDATSNVLRQRKLRLALNNASAFDGTNGSGIRPS